MADSTPAVPKALIEWLERTNPNDLNRLVGKSKREMIHAIGRQQIIRELRTIYNQQNKTGEQA